MGCLLLASRCLNDAVLSTGVCVGRGKDSDRVAIMAAGVARRVFIYSCAEKLSWPGAEFVRLGKLDVQGEASMSDQAWLGGRGCRRQGFGLRKAARGMRSRCDDGVWLLWNCAALREGWGKGFSGLGLGLVQHSRCTWYEKVDSVLRWMM